MELCLRRTRMFVPVTIAALMPFLAGQGCPAPIADDLTGDPQIVGAGATSGDICGLQVPCGCPKPQTVNPNVTPADALTIVQACAAGPGLVILDVRSPEEYATGHLENAHNACVLCPSPSFRDAISGFDRSLTYLVYCRTGKRSVTAGNIMAEEGFANVYNMTGGITQWQAEGFPVVQ